MFKVRLVYALYVSTAHEKGPELKFMKGCSREISLPFAPFSGLEIFPPGDALPAKINDVAWIEEEQAFEASCEDDPVSAAEFEQVCAQAIAEGWTLENAQRIESEYQVRRRKFRVVRDDEPDGDGGTDAP